MEANNLRSRNWFAREGKDGIIYRAWMKNQGIPAHHFEGKPIIGICNTWSELTPCNAHFRELAQKVKNGIYEAGGIPVEFPVMSTGETLIKPTAMLYRNLVSMDVEESIRANPMDGVVLLCGCDKTTPSLVMGACSVDIPTIVVSGGPMLTGKYRGTNISTSDLWRFSEAQRMGEITQKDMQEVEAGMCRSAGHCGVMGTASTMACMVESLGLSLPGNAAIPAVDSNRRVLAHHAGMRIVEMVKENMTLSKILTREAFENAIMVNTAIGGSTNFVLHLLAIAGRIGVELTLDDMNNLAKDIPLLLNLQPSGQFFMEDFYYAGGLPVVLKQLDKHLHGHVITVNGKTMRDNFSSAISYDDRVIGSMEKPVNPVSGVAVLKGNLCPDGAVLKLSAASPALMQHKGQAIVFEDIDDYKNRINDPDLPATADSVLVLKQVGPVGYPGMPEVGNLGLPPKLLLEGVRDMVRISDGRMSGTGFGTCILHVSPESAVGGPLAIVRDGDWIELNVPERSLNLLLSQEEINERLSTILPFNGIVDRGYVRIHQTHVEQAHLGADLDFLKGGSGSKVTKDSH